MRKGLSTPGDLVCKCWRLFAYYPPRVLLNCMRDEQIHSGKVELLTVGQK